MPAMPAATSRAAGAQALDARRRVEQRLTRPAHVALRPCPRLVPGPPAVGDLVRAALGLGKIDPRGRLVVARLHLGALHDGELGGKRRQRLAHLGRPPAHLVDAPQQLDDGIDPRRDGAVTALELRRPGEHCVDAGAHDVSIADGAGRAARRRPPASARRCSRSGTGSGSSGASR
ncbi:hypothetical protein [Gaiella occulta]|uniref:hypothetical protein n=1 Tax=Gaiella occulta TaxID=1002870 RepID=UPI000E0C4B28|nr:hypothetical protein [Gaiella occulta]